MLESLVSTLLNRVLGAYVSNLNYNQLQIGIWSGKGKGEEWGFCIILRRVKRIYFLFYYLQERSSYEILSSKEKHSTSSICPSTLSKVTCYRNTESKVNEVF